MLKLFRLSALTALALGATALTAHAQNPQTRDGFWFNLGLGYGSATCSDACSSEGGFSGNLALGGTLNQKVLLGGGTTGWTKSEDGATLTLGTVLALIRFYPSATGGFFLNGGLGYGSTRASYSGFSDSESGFAMLLGLGYDFRVGKNFSLTPFLNGFGYSTESTNWSVGQIGLGFTSH